MTLSSFKRSTLISGIRYENMLVGNDYYVPPSFESIATLNPTGNAASAEFTSIPSGYASLQIRGIIHDNNPLDGAPNTGFDLNFTMNNDTATNYSNHYLYGNGSTAVAAGAANSSIINLPGTRQIATANYMSALVIDILDYTSTTKYKTVRTFCGSDANGTGGTNRAVALNSGNYRSLSAITTITFFAYGTGFVAGSTFALYGIKG